VGQGAAGGPRVCPLPHQSHQALRVSLHHQLVSALHQLPCAAAGYCTALEFPMPVQLHAAPLGDKLLPDSQLPAHVCGLPAHLPDHLPDHPPGPPAVWTACLLTIGSRP
jgi:hypothetical protein